MKNPFKQLKNIEGEIEKIWHNLARKDKILYGGDKNDPLRNEGVMDKIELRIKFGEIERDQEQLYKTMTAIIDYLQAEIKFREVPDLRYPPPEPRPTVREPYLEKKKKQ